MSFLRLWLQVYGILMVQLVLTGAIIAVFLLVNSVKSYVQRNQWVYWTSLVLMLVCLIRFTSESREK